MLLLQLKVDNQAESAISLNLGRKLESLRHRHDSSPLFSSHQNMSGPISSTLPLADLTKSERNRMKNPL